MFSFIVVSHSRDVYYSNHIFFMIYFTQVVVVLLKYRLPISLAATWVFILVSVADLVNAFIQGTRESIHHCMLSL